MSAPEALRAELRGRTSKQQIASCLARTTRRGDDIELRATVRALRCAAERIQTLTTEARELEKEIDLLVQAMAPELLALVGVGPISTAQVLVGWSHRGRFRSDAAFAAFAGAAPIPASSRLTTRHRLNRAGDRQLSRALHTVVPVQARADPATRAYIAKRSAEGEVLPRRAALPQARRRPPGVQAPRTPGTISRARQPGTQGGLT
ncbi:transposase [Parafrankia sp. EUN1f]|uniref:transposase n=1 Tax=Parafrankia sp. EUN1f TaxID=102897 RepID=UPI0001C45EAF|nr:transposase [Parafrankia sp. EUN1f]EFC82232.1 transposase IS116/IS110/IS902 family protein [Parafrankia sp. EUN1f]